MAMNTIKEAILRTLQDDLKAGAFPNEIYKHIIAHSYYEFTKGKTPWDTVSAQLSMLIKYGDTRVARTKKAKDGKKNGQWFYYATKNQSQIDTYCPSAQEKSTSYHERDLHPLLATYLKVRGVKAKTIYHEQSNKKEEYQKWIHPDMIGVKYVEMENPTCQSLFKATSGAETVEIYSYELKRSIVSDYELKQCFFQAVSNSSWANYGFLVAFEIDTKLYDEIERLNHSFGIGIIKLSSKPFESKVLYPAQRHNLDFRTIDKLCKVNNDFCAYMAQIETSITTVGNAFKNAMQVLDSMTDECFSSDSEILEYCKKHHIPTEEEE